MTSHHQRIVSLWDMLQSIHGEKMLRSLAYIAGIHTEFMFHRNALTTRPRGDSVSLTSDDVQLIFHHLGEINKVIMDLKMIAASVALERAMILVLEKVGKPQFDRDDCARLITALSVLLHTVPDSFRAQSVYVLTGGAERYIWGDRLTFGDDVSDAFPSAEYDISEAAKCIAFERWTAAVMHLMRAVEVGLVCLQSAVEVDLPKEQWDQIINQIEAKIRQVTKKSHGKDGEQWFSEAASHFRLMKNAWRNYAHHGSEKYDEERTMAIYESVRSFMRHLATRLKE